MSDWPQPWPSGAAERHRAAAEVFARRVRGVRDWSAQAPPEGWVAADVVRHLLEWLPGLLSSELGVDLPPVDADGDPAATLPAAWDRRCADVQRLIETEGAKPCTAPVLGAMTVAEMVDRFYTSDVVMHVWDLARATGQDDTLPPDFCADAVAGMEPMADRLTASGHFGPRVPVPDDASAQDRLIGLIGRDPAWRVDPRRWSASSS